jgi:hypothetical protein
MGRLQRQVRHRRACDEHHALVELRRLPASEHLRRDRRRRAASAETHDDRAAAAGARRLCVQH